MKKEEYTLDYPLDYFFNAENIPNQDLVFMTYDYFESGQRAGHISPLEFLNLLEFNFEFLKFNVTKPFVVLDHLKSIPIEEEVRHILMGFLLKWFGGYPIENMDEQYNTTLRLIEREFLNYAEETPEKKICQRDWNEYSRTKEIEKFINENVDVAWEKQPKNNPDDWEENFEKSVSELHRREFKEVGGVKIELTSSNQLLKDLEFNYPLEHAPLSYYHTWKEDLKYLKIEIMDNLMMLPEIAKIHYLDRLKYQFTEKQSAAFTTEQEYFQLLSKYNTTREDIIENIDYNNKIFEVVRSDVPSFHETMEPDFFPDTTNIQLIFYNYQFGEAIKEAISFIDEQLSTRTEKNKKENEKPAPPTIVDNTQNGNLALDNLIESLRYKEPHDIGPFESFNLWDNNLRAFFREVLHNLSEKLPDNKKHYLDLVTWELKEKEKNIFISDKQYDSLLADFKFDRETVLNNFDCENQLISALASKAIILDPSWPPGYNEYEESLQHVFYNFHYGQTLQKALDFINNQYNGIGPSTSSKKEIPRSASNQYYSFQYKQWSHKSESITELLNFLKDNNFIDKQTDVAIFRQLFKNELVSKKLVWLSTVTDLSYFIKGVSSHHYIDGTKQKLWAICINCFELSNGKDLSTSQLRSQKKPANTSLLDKALKIL